MSIMPGRQPMPTATYDGNTYKVRSRKIEVPDLAAMDRIDALIWLNRHTYPTGVSNRPAAPNLAGLNLTVR